MAKIKIRSKEREELIPITSRVQDEIESSAQESGSCTVFVRHTTCGVTINENADPDVRHDILLFLRELIPQFYKGFLHFEHNSDSHIKSSLMGPSLVVPFEAGRLLLGRWQDIYLCEFDGPREREVIITISR